MASTKKTLERLELIFTANQEQFDKQLKSIEDSIAGVKTSVDGVSTGMGKNMTGAMTKASLIAQVLIKVFEKVAQVVIKIAKTVYELGKNLMTSGSSLTRMRIATNTLGKNIGITQKELDGLRGSLADANTYGLKAEKVISSLARTGLIQMAKGLEGVDARTGKTAKGINSLVLTMKDLGAVAGKSSGEAISDITEFINTGRTQSVEGMIAIGNLGTEYRMYAKTIDKSRNELTAQEEAQARLNLVVREGTKAFGAYADSYTTSGKMMDSITDTMKSVFEELGTMLEPIWASATTAILKFVQNVRDFVKQNEAVIKAWATKVAGWVVYVAETIASFMSKIPIIGSVFESLKNIQIKVAKASGEAEDSIDGQTDAMESASGSASKLNKELRGLAGFDEMNVLKEPETAGGGGGSATSPTTPGIFENFGAEVDKVIEGIKNKVAERLDPIKKKLAEFFKPMVDMWNNWVKPAFDGLLAVLKEVWGSVSKSPLKDFFTWMTQALGVVLIGVIGGLIYAITGLIAMWGEVASVIFTTFNIAKNTVAVFTAWFKGDTEGMRNAFVNLWNSMPAPVQNAIVSISNWIVQKVAWIRNTFENLKWTIPAVFEYIRWRVASFIQSIVDDVSYKVNTIKNRFVDMGNRIGSALRDVINNLIWRINTMFINRINSIRIGGLSMNIPSVPYLARGGIVENPTLAMIGEAGKEAVMPLERNTEWIDKLAEKISMSGGSGGGNLIVKIGDDTIYEKAIDYIREKGLRTGTNILNL